MGIGGHILGEKKLRQLNRFYDTDYDRAYRRNAEVEARRIVDGVCTHYRGVWGEPLVPLDDGIRRCWTSCPRREA